MVSISNIAKYFFDTILKIYGEPNGFLNDSEIYIGNEIISIVETLLQSENFDISSEFTLDIDNERNVEIAEYISEDDLNEFSPDNSIPPDLSSYSLAYMKRVVDFSWTASGKRKREQTIQHFFRNPNLKHRQIYRMRQYVNNMGNKFEKFHSIKKYIFENFKIARQNGFPVHDIDLQTWAHKYSREIDYEKFKASPTFITHFKKQYGISGRKITKLVTKSKVENSEYFENQAVEFVLHASDIMKSYSQSHILNTDQSSFSKELTSMRTLSFKTDKHVQGTIQSANAVSHSVTIQPVISMDGTLLSKFLLIHQEPQGAFGPRVYDTLLNPPNVVITCTKSGKSSKYIHNFFLDNVIKPTLSEKALILLDCWSGQKGEHTEETFSIGEHSCQLLHIPPGTTSLVQPCDVYFFRQWKYFAKKISNFIILHYINEINIHERNNITKLHCLIHNQLSASAFKNMIKYAWWKSTYPVSKPEAFKNVKQICFTFQQNQSCYTENCITSAFICCSHCSNFICFSHFFIDFHSHF